MPAKGVNFVLQILFVFIIFVIFFRGLFLPQLSVYSTADYGRSEVWSFNYPLKELLSRSLKSGTLPFWTKDVGGGYPVFAEALAGTFYLPNLILFGLLPTPLAWNISYVVIFLTAFTGSYLLFFKNTKSSKAAIFGSLVFTFNGYFITHIYNYSLIQAASVLPLVLFFAQILWERTTKLNFFIFAFIFSQQILVGHIHVVILTLILTVLVFFILNYKSGKEILLFKAKVLFASIIFALALSAPQLLPSVELYRQSILAVPGMSELNRFPYKLTDIVTTVFPGLLGNPKSGQIAFFSSAKGVPWENNSFVGAIPVIFALAVFFKKVKNGFLISMFLLLFLSFLMALGKNSPLFFLYFLPGLNMFRVSSRFLLLLVFSLSGLSSVGLDAVIIFLEKRLKYFTDVFFWLIILATTFSLFKFGLTYNPTVPFADFLKKPEVSGFIPEGKRVYTWPSQFSEWNKIFLAKGSGDMNKFLFFRNGLEPYLNVLYGKSNVASEISAPLKRQAVAIKYPDINLLSALSTELILTTEKFNSKTPLQLIKTFSPGDNSLSEFYLYKNPLSAPRFRFVKSYEVRSFDYKNPDWYFTDKSLTFNNAAILESPPGEKIEPNGLQNIKVIEDSNQKTLLEVNSGGTSLLFIADTHYPGWEAFVNGKKVNIINANINGQAIVVFPGKSLVELRFFPYSFYLGLLTAIIGLYLFSFLRLNLNKT